MYEILQTPEFREWLDGLDPRTRGQILIVPNRMARGSWGDCKPIAGAPGVFEVALQFRWSNSLVIPAKAGIQ